MNKSPILLSAILCDEVVVENGKYTFKGIFSQINAQKFPALHKDANIVTIWSNGVGIGFKQNIVIKTEGKNDIIFDSSKLEQQFSLANEKSVHTIIGRMSLVFNYECSCALEIYLNGVKQPQELNFKVAKESSQVVSRINSLVK